MSRQLHWAEGYIGRPCGLGIGFDCADLAALVQKEVFGQTINLPQVRDYADKSGSRKFKAMSDQIGRLQEDFAELTDNPSDGDPVLLTVRGYSQHVGVYCRISGEPWILHATDAAKQVVLQRLRDLPIRGIKVEGYYKWK